MGWGFSLKVHRSNVVTRNTGIGKEVHPIILNKIINKKCTSRQKWAYLVYTSTTNELYT